MSAADTAGPLDDRERDRLLTGFLAFSRILVAVSGGPDSTALLWLAAHWRATRGGGPELLVATVDHALRPEAAAEAAAVARLSARLGLPHRTLVWTGDKPRHGLQAAARDARFGLLLAEARAAGAQAVALAHTEDDQAETVLFRLARGSGLRGLAAMRPATARDGVALLRPLLGVPKARLVATLEAAGVPFARDPANADPRFTRARLRQLAPHLAAEGLDARRLAQFARRAARLDAAVEAAVDAAARTVGLARGAAPDKAETRFDAAGFLALPEEIALRLLGRALAALGREGPVELGKLEALTVALRAHLGEAAAPRGAFRRTLAGALVAVCGGQVVVTRAPPRRAT
ncbi:tRNA lysidine(34) synthetase TilS [Xanthobacter sp. V4C-4]|uniref:tRNA lysidine(34) synthetase TilS n=1 Tax=Xanthobacter cornucopiae TaxID=3119924 RepID=UPI003727F142